MARRTTSLDAGSPATRVRMRLRRFVCATACASLLAGLVVGPAGAAPTWLLPAKSLSGPSVQDVQVVIDDQGNTTAVWCSTESGLVVQSSSRPAGGSWSPVVDLGAGCHPEIVLTPTGRVTAVWPLFEEGNRLRWSSKQTSGTWTPAADVFAEERDVESFSLATDTAGTLTMVFAEATESGDILRSTRLAGDSGTGSWSSPVDVTADGTHGRPAVVADSAGRVTAAWTEAGDVFASSLLAGGTWSSPADDIGMGVAPSLGVDAKGTVTIAWRSPDGVMSTRSRPAGGAWSSLVPLNEGGDMLFSTGPVLAVGPGGEAVAAWSAPDAMDKELPYAAYRAAGSTTFGEAVPLDDPELPVGEFDLDTDGSGGFVATWAEGTMISANHVKAAHFSGGSWSEAVPLTEPEQGFSAKVDLNSSGDGVVAFEGDFANGRRARVVALDVAGPVASKVQVPAGVAPRTRATFSVTAKDTWSDVASYQWSFGDGKSVTGRQVRHAFPKNGRYRVTLTMTDAVGNATSLTRTVEVRPKPVLKVFTLTDATIRVGEKTRLRVKLNTKATLKLVLKGKAKGVRAVIKKTLPKGTTRITLRARVAGKKLVPDTYVIKGTAKNLSGRSPAKKITLKVVR